MADENPLTQQLKKAADQRNTGDSDTAAPSGKRGPQGVTAQCDTGYLQLLK